ncbi:MAG: alpha/beta fold hydrolase [Caulobacteraceae bacterium]
MKAPELYAKARDGVRIAYRDEGPRDRPAVLLCTMGGGSSMGVWESLVGPLSVQWRVIRHDRRGDGESDPGVPESHSFSTYVADALAVLDALALDQAVICGMAFGARVALHLARDAPERASGLILFDATGGPPAPEAERRAGQIEARRLRAEAGLAEPKRDRAWFERRDPAGAGLSRNAFRDLPPWTPGLAAITAPSLIACGEQDPNLEGARRLAREIPDARFASMPMCGHASILERPDLVLDLVRGFLEADSSDRKARRR